MTSVPLRRQNDAWRWPVVLALSATVPAFYLELLRAEPPALAGGAYLLAAVVLGASLSRAWRDESSWWAAFRAHPLDVLLLLGLLAAAALPASSASTAALIFRLAVAFLTLLRLVLSLQHVITRGGLVYLLFSAGLVLGLCGVGFWWLEPRATTLADGLWLAFTTAATVGYGDIVPSTTASKIFSVFVVMLGFGVLSLVTAAIATRWIETEERIIEREILRDVHRQMDALHRELVEVRACLEEFTAREGGVRQRPSGFVPGQTPDERP